tara:strand:+ start:215 stop:640 length:426 start_codon:yes stop_codon:yes gene_type:complete
MYVSIRQIHPDAKYPEKSTEGSAAYDLYTPEKVRLPSGKVTIVHTGLSMEIPEGYKGEIYSRSGLATQGVWVANQPGKIDSDYRGEIMVLLYNSQDGIFTLPAGSRVAQLEINPVKLVTFIDVAELTTTSRGEGGFGSTGV